MAKCEIRIGHLRPWFDSAPGHQEFSKHEKWSVESLVSAAVWHHFPLVFQILPDWNRPLKGQFMNWGFVIPVLVSVA